TQPTSAATEGVTEGTVAKTVATEGTQPTSAATEGVTEGTVAKTVATEGTQPTSPATEGVTEGTVAKTVATEGTQPTSAATEEMTEGTVAKTIATEGTQPTSAATEEVTEGTVAETVATEGTQPTSPATEGVTEGTAAKTVATEGTQPTSAATEEVTEGTVAKTIATEGTQPTSAATEGVTEGTVAKTVATEGTQPTSAATEGVTEGTVAKTVATEGTQPTSAATEEVTEGTVAKTVAAEGTQPTSAATEGVTEGTVAKTVATEGTQPTSAATAPESREETISLSSSSTPQMQETTMKKFCEHMEYIETLIANNAVTTSPEDISNKNDLISRGVDFVDKNPRIIVHIPKDGAIIRDVKIPSTNLNEVTVIFTTILGVVVGPIRGSPTALAAHEFPTESVAQIIIDLTSTMHNSPPKGVTLSIVACAPGTTTVMTEGTTSIGRESTETIPIGATMPGETETTIISISAESVSTIGYVPETSAASETIATSTAKITIPAATSSESSEETVSLSSTSTSKMQETTMKKFCEHMEYIETLIGSNAVTTSPEDISNKNDLISRGVDFVDKNPRIIINIPKDGAIIRDIKVPSANLNEVTVIFTTILGVVVGPILGSPTSLPADEFPTERVAKIIIDLTSTMQDSPPKGVTLSIVACAPGTTTAMTEGTTSIGRESTETIPIGATMPGETETTIISISAESVSTIGYVPETSAASETIATSTAKITIPAATSSESSEETVSLSSTSTSKMQETTMKKFCEHMEYIETLIGSNAVTTSPEDISNKNDLISRGVDFVDKNPRIIINIPKDGAIIRDIKVPSANLNEVTVIFTTIFGVVVGPIQGSPTDLSADKFPIERVAKIIIDLTSTMHDSPPKGVTLSIVACAPGTTTVKPEGNIRLFLSILDEPLSVRKDMLRSPL
ncbi:unnamed protein product, partial [Rotaria sp. Silwood2]